MEVHEEDVRADVLTTRPTTGLAPAPSSPIAIAARAFGDDYPLTVSQRDVRIVSVLVIATLAWYLPWLGAHLTLGLYWVTIPFVIAHVITVVSLVLTMVTSWTRSVPPPRRVPFGAEPTVGVIIPTCGEPPSMILRTVESVLTQDWPHDRLVVVVSDDGHDPALRTALARYPVQYYDPPDRYAPGRDGAAKAGNLNAAVAYLDEHFPGIEFIETRDADDEVGSTSFLRLTVGQLMADTGLAYAQTIKEAQVSAGDPFNNREQMFYRNMMLAKNHAKSVFPCGSGVVWRREALDDIGGFPVWNLVEDLQSGFEAMRRGWRNIYVPIVGAIGQHAPEDVPNVYKQRGTWAVDTVRLMTWADRTGLTLRQRAHFTMTVMYYLTAFSTLTYMACVVVSLLGFSPVEDDSFTALGYILPFALANELFLLVSNHPFNDRRTKQRTPFRDAWRVRVLWTGMAPVYALATAIAIGAGPNRKPIYKVTRKSTDSRWHWRQTAPHIAFLVAVVLGGIVSVGRNTLENPGALTATLYFGLLYSALNAAFITRGWHAVSTDRTPSVERRRAG